MPRAGKASAGPITVLEDDEPYVVTVVDARLDREPAYQKPGFTSDKLTVTLGITDDPDDTIRVFLTVATFADDTQPKGAGLGKNKTTGKVSKLRAFLNAIADKDENTEITGVDWAEPDAPFHMQWTYGDRLEFQAGAQCEFELEGGAKVTVRGTSVENDQGYFNYKVEKFRPASRATRPAATQARQTLAKRDIPAKGETVAADVPF